MAHVKSQTCAANGPSDIWAVNLGGCRSEGGSVGAPAKRTRKASRSKQFEVDGARL
ncbi:hypothetical protein B0H10DRAFT_2089704, partial [Mycena sp. CBHHK59/15]